MVRAFGALDRTLPLAGPRFSQLGGRSRTLPVSSQGCPGRGMLSCVREHTCLGHAHPPRARMLGVHLCWGLRPCPWLVSGPERSPLTVHCKHTSMYARFSTSKFTKVSSGGPTTEGAERAGAGLGPEDGVGAR